MSHHESVSPLKPTLPEHHDSKHENHLLVHGESGKSHHHHHHHVGGGGGGGGGASSLPHEREHRFKPGVGHVMDHAAGIVTIVGPEAGDAWEAQGGGGTDADQPVGLFRKTTSAIFKRSESQQLFDQEQVEEETVEFSDVDGYVSPPLMLQYLNEALSNNPRLTLKLEHRRFLFAETLEGIAERTDPAYAPPGSPFGVKVTWGQLVDRLVKYVGKHNFDTDESHLNRIFNVLRSSVLRARSTEAGAHLNSSELLMRAEEEEQANERERRREVGDGQDAGAAPRTSLLDLYRAKQSFLDSRGVTGALLTAVATHTAGIEGNAADTAVHLLNELLYTGNAQVQQSVYDHVTHRDPDNKFLAHFKMRIAFAREIVRERKSKVVLAFVPMTEGQREGFNTAIQTFTALKNLCEGHNLKLQDLLREQPMHQSEHNLVHEVVAVFCLQVGTVELLKRKEEAELELLCHTMDLLTDMLQGPCWGNQELVSRDEFFLHSADLVLQSGFHSRINKGLRISTKAKVLILIASMLEGRTDFTVHRKMATFFDAEVFDTAHGYFSRTLRATQEAEAKLGVAVASARMDVIMTGTVSLQQVANELNLVTKFNAFSRESMHDLKRSNKLVIALDRVASIEVLWNGRIERVNFPLQVETAYLSTSSKSNFLKLCHIETAEKRMKELLGMAPIFILEMEERNSLAAQFNVYRQLSRNISSIKWSMYALVVLLNINVVMASYGSKHEKKGYKSAVAGLRGEVEPSYVNSLIITWVLGIVNAMGYITIVGFLALTEVPLIIRATDEVIEQHDGIPLYDWGAFTWWGVTLGANVMFIIMHVSNYPGGANYGLYYFLVLGINLPWTLLCVRRCIVVPADRRARVFVIAFDTLLTKPFFRNHVLLLGCSVLGFQEPQWFTLMLLDIINNSSVLQDIIKSITRPLPQLAVVFYTFIITVVIYAQFGVAYFEEWFHYDEFEDVDEEGAPHGCHSVVGCFWLVFYLGVPHGGMGQVVDNVSNRDESIYLARVLYDLSFFVWVGILLFNVITGLIVDTFSTLREEANAREDVLTNSCFVCGLTRTQYDDATFMGGFKSFDQHQNEDHILWNYVFFLQYLKRKDPTEFTGVETYVKGMLEDNNLGWIPQRTCFSLLAKTLSENDDDDGIGGGAGGNIRKVLRAEMRQLGDGIQKLSERIGQLETTVAATSD